MRRPSSRGQAMIETALGMLVFVTVLLFGIHFAELGYLTLKIQEAANAAVWDATSRKVHDTYAANRWSLYTGAINFGENQTQTRYNDFDGVFNGAGTVTQVMTRGTNLNINCRPMNSPGINVQGYVPVASLQGPYPNGQSGISCVARAQLSPIRIPTGFFNDSFFAGNPHVTVANYSICATGRAQGGGCTGNLPMLLDDWGFSGAAEARQCALSFEGGSSCANQPYHSMVRAAFNHYPAAHAGAASKLAETVIGGSPIKEDHFFMSFRGRESNVKPFHERLKASHGDIEWETTPYNNPDVASGYYNPARTNCWLGKPCL